RATVGHIKGYRRHHDERAFDQGRHTAACERPDDKTCAILESTPVIFDDRSLVVAYGVDAQRQWRASLHLGGRQKSIPHRFSVFHERWRVEWKQERDMCDSPTGLRPRGILGTLPSRRSRRRKPAATGG